MSAESENLRDALVDQLSSFDSRLDEKIDDVAILAEIQDGIGRLLSDDGKSEAEIRRVLQERYENGDLRKETFQLVKSMLDRFVTEHTPTSPGQPDPKGRIEPARSIQDRSMIVYRLDPFCVIDSCFRSVCRAAPWELSTRRSIAGLQMPVTSHQP
jgi:hypothetical protein